METKKRDNQGADEENVLGECEETTGMQTEEAPFITMETSDGVNSTRGLLTCYITRSDRPLGDATFFTRAARGR